MADVFVISVHDLSSANHPQPVEDMNVKVGVDQAEPSAVNTYSGTSKWTRECPCPPSARKVRVVVQSTTDAFWDIDVTVDITRDSSGPPRIDRAALLLLNVTDVVAYRANNGRDWILRLELTACQVKDWAKEVLGQTKSLPTPSCQPGD